MSESPNNSSPDPNGLSPVERGALTLASLDHLHEAISIFDRDLRLRVWNRRFVELLDFPPELIRDGLPLAELFRFNARRGEYGPGDPETQVEERVKLAERFESHGLERTRSNGTVLEIRGEPIAGGGFITVYEDITARRRAEAELRESHEQLEARIRERTAELLALNARLAQEMEERKQAQRALGQAQKLKAVGQLTGGVAHDFNNLLTIILGNLAMLEEGLRDNPELYKSAHTAMNAGRRGADLTRRLLAFSRQQALQPRLLGPGQQLQEIAELLQRALGASIELETVADPAVWNIRVDPGQLTNAVLNLAINARDAMPGGGRLRIEASNVMIDAAYTARYPDVVPGDYVRLAVSDTGCGMGPEVLERAFEPFFTTKELGAGTGLGLSMVYGFIKQSGGHVRIRSQVGVGTTVELYLSRHTPRGRETVAASEAAPDENRLRGREKILLVEDDPDIRHFVARTLIGLGYVVREAANGREALVVLASNVPLDLLLSDMTMPGGIGGHDLAREARRRRPALRVLLMSGFSNMTGQLPADCALLEKPFQKLDLARAVRLALDRPATLAGDGPAEQDA